MVKFMHVKTLFFHIIIRSKGLWKTFKDVVKNEKVKALWMGTIPVRLVDIYWRYILFVLEIYHIREVSVLERWLY